MAKTLKKTDKKRVIFVEDKVNSYVVDEKTTFRNKKRLWKKLVNG